LAIAQAQSDREFVQLDDTSLGLLCEFAVQNAHETYGARTQHRKPELLEAVIIDARGIGQRRITELDDPQTRRSQ